MMTKTNRKRQIDRMDKLWSKRVVERDNGICQKCGKPGDNPHHVIPRRYLAVRHVLDNGLTLCTSCHVPYAHKRILEFLGWFKEKFPERYRAIEKIKHNVKPDLDKIEEELKGNDES